jgi:hypothetical protein
MSANPGTGTDNVNDDSDPYITSDSDDTDDTFYSNNTAVTNESDRQPEQTKAKIDDDDDDDEVDFEEETEKERNERLERNREEERLEAEYEVSPRIASIVLKNKMNDKKKNRQRIKKNNMLSLVENNTLPLIENNILPLIENNILPLVEADNICDCELSLKQDGINIALNQESDSINQDDYVGFESKLVEMFRVVVDDRCNTWEKFIDQSDFCNRVWNEFTDTIDFYHRNYAKSIKMKSDLINLYNYGGNYYDYMRTLMYGKTHWSAMNLVKIRHNYWKSYEIEDDDENDYGCNDYNDDKDKKPFNQVVALPKKNQSIKGGKHQRVR